MNTRQIKAGLFGIGLNTYWNQFEGLLERLQQYQKKIHARISEFGVDVIDPGMIDTVEKAREAATLFKIEDVEIIFLYVSTYALSSTVLPVVQKVNVPVIVLNLQPVRAIDYDRFNRLGDRGLMTGEWLANCQACSVPEIASVFNRAGIDFYQITGTLDDPEAWQEIEDWIDAASVAQVMRNNRLGILGHYYNGMLDVYSDLTQHAIFFGSHIELLEMCELAEIRRNVSDSNVEKKIREIYQSFSVLADCDASEIKRAARTAVALDKLVDVHKLGSLAYYYEGTDGSEYQDIITSVITGNSLLTGKGIPVAGELEVKNVQAMKIMDAFGAGGSFSEFYAMDFNDDIVILGHDGPGHIAIAAGKPILKPLGVYHGKPGKGLSVEMKVIYGPVTVLSVVQDRDGKLRMIYAEGDTVPGPILEIGNTNSRYKFPISVKQFVNDWSREGPSHHCAVGVGHIGRKIERLGALLSMEVKKIC